jgi:hypothetical protein
MKSLKVLGLAAVAAMALTVIGTGTASATTLEVGGAIKNESVLIAASLEPGTSSLLQTTSGQFANTCTNSYIFAETTTVAGANVSGPVSVMSFTNCTTSPVVVDAKGSLSVERIGSTTNGTVRSSSANVTVPSPLGGTLTCVTGEGTDIGTLTGVKGGNATIDINAVLNCGFLSPSTIWEASYTVTSPAGLGVTEKARETTLEVGGAVKNESVAITASLEPKTSSLLQTTSGQFANTCTESHITAQTTTFTGTRVSGPVSVMSFTNCTTSPVVVDAKGSLSVERIGSTTNGTVRSSGAKVTVPSPLGGTLTCITGEDTDIGTLAGVKEGNSTLDISVVLNCGFLSPSTIWDASYTVTSPTGLGVSEKAPVTTLEVGGAIQNESVEVTASLKAGTSALLQTTSGAFANTCNESHVSGKTSVFTGGAVSGPINSLAFTNCTTSPVVVDAKGSLSVERIGSTTNGTVRSSGAKVTVPSPLGGTLTCITGTSVDIGTLTGVKEGSATMDINAVLNCGFLAPSSTWTGTYTVTSPAGLGVTE